MVERKLSHILLKKSPEQIKFSIPPKPVDEDQIPNRDIQLHKSLLQRELEKAWSIAEKEQQEQAVYHITRKGIYLEFQGEEGYNLVAQSLEQMRGKKQEKWIRILNVRREKRIHLNSTTSKQEEKETIYATIFVPHDKKQFFFKQLEDYANKLTKTGKAKNLSLINSITNIRKALNIESFWQDDKILIPATEQKWCEVWLNSDTDEVIQRFISLLKQEQIRSQTGVIRFPERTVLLIYVNRTQLERLSQLSDDIAEYRCAKETAAVWTELENREQVEWVKELLLRLQVKDSSISVCILDRGVNHKHPLLSRILNDADCQCIISTWGTYDHDKHGHGTMMAGVAGYGDLIQCITDKRNILINHCLESVKIIPKPPGKTEPGLWGYMTSQGISLAEIQAPTRKRVFCMAITSEDTRDRGRPTSWSSAIDQLASGANDETRRLIIVSAGNISDINSAKNYPNAQKTDSIHDPAQAWNALTVGAYNALDKITVSGLSGYSPIAPRGGLSPFSTTSYTWEDKWPIKPDIVMEGGNLAQDATGFVTECADMALLPTYFDPQKSHFTFFNMTSAATAQAAWFAAQIQVRYPNFWPETIRALMIHSARWPDPLKKQFIEKDSKSSFKRLLRICGYGVPDLDRAIYSASNALTLISQETLRPFTKEGSNYKIKNMALYELPWPKEVLRNLPPETKVEMRITLSYFIEPGPGERGWRDRYRYASHALRFDLNSPGESKKEFTTRINAAIKDEEGNHTKHSAAEHWVIGSQARDKGSIHSDIWQGTSAELAASNIIAVYPCVGWWRERHNLNKWDSQARYALVVSITTPDEKVDVYTPVAIQLGIKTPVTVEITTEKSL